MGNGSLPRSGCKQDTPDSDRLDRGDRPDFYPTGDGKFTVSVRPTKQLGHLELLARGLDRSPPGNAVKDFGAVKSGLDTN